MNLPEVAAIGAPRLLAGLDRLPRLDFRSHLEVQGRLDPLHAASLVDLAELIKLTGRGGAGFPFATKMRAVLSSAQRAGSRTVVVVNATEGEPASAKDKTLIARVPHLVLDGAALAAYALHAMEIVVGVADGGLPTGSLLRALRERRMPVPTRVVTVPHRFISGEGGALVRGINGESPIPPGRKVRASDKGVGGLPTLLSNAETFAQLALAARLGPDGYCRIGTAAEPGTVLLTVGGSATRPAVVEVPIGTPLATVLDLCGAQVGAGVLTGGFHGKWLPAGAAPWAEISREGLAAAGGSLGAGIIAPLGAGTCPLGEAARVVQYLAGESAGQCGPCRLGLPDVARALTSLTAGGGAAAMEEIRAAAGTVRGRGACSHPDGTSRFALSALEAFTEDVAAHMMRDGCGQPVRGVLPLPGNDSPASHLLVDWTRCDGHGLCAHVVPELVRLDANGYPAFRDTPVPQWLHSGARKAVAMCPALALRLTGAAQAKH